ncbi:hypothetical protein C0431_12605 [bacterium]|nr:hypothetical protein [bacterium]
MDNNLISEIQADTVIFSLTVADFSPHIVNTIARELNVSEESVLKDPVLKKKHDALIKHAFSTFTIPFWGSHVRNFTDSTFMLMEGKSS